MDPVIPRGSTVHDIHAFLIGWRAAEAAQGIKAWADMAANGLQWVRNIVAGVSDPAVALANLEENLKHCEASSAATPPAAPVQPVAFVVEAEYEDGSPAGHRLEWCGRNEANDFPEGTQFYNTPPAAPPAPVQEPLGKLCVFDDADSEFGWSYDISGNAEQHRRLKELDGAMLYTTPPAQPAPVQETVPEGVITAIRNEGLTLVKDLRGYRLMRLGKVEAQATPPAAQPAVPDEITDNSESPEYIQGWNDCRSLMLEMRKP